MTRQGGLSSRRSQSSSFVISQVRADNPDEFARNIGKGIAAVTAQQTNVKALTTERGFEFASVISQVLKDQTGATTATALRDLVLKIDSFANDSSLLSDQFKQANTIDKRIEILRQTKDSKRSSLNSSAVLIHRSQLRKSSRGLSVLLL
ncbi:MAG: hypothetical protein R3C20_00250 [Planctomycetaceae bacterium]